MLATKRERRWLTPFHPSAQKPQNPQGIGTPDFSEPKRQLIYDIGSMPWIEAQLHGQRVYARTTEDGTFVLNGNFVEVCYRRGPGRLYRARASNLTRTPDAVLLPDDTCSPETTEKSPDGASGTPSSGSSSRVGANGKSRTRDGAKTAEVPPPPKDAVIVYADGACSGNPGPAGLGVVVVDGRACTEISEYLGTGTNNIAELSAIDRALDQVEKATRPVVIHTDSSYSIGVLSKGWKAKANVELVKRLKNRLSGLPSVRFVYVRGHAGVPLNERADELAREAVRTGQTRTERTTTE